MWLALAAIAIGVTAVLWYRSDADLADLDRQAAAVGLASSWSAFSRPRSPAPQLARWQRLEQLAAAIGSYADSYDSTYDKNRPPQPGQPLPPELAVHHAALPSAELAELLALCDDLAGVTLDRHASIDWSTRMPEIDATRRVSRLLVERAALVPGDQVADECARLLALAMAHRPISLIQGLVATSQLTLWCGAVARRLHEETDYAVVFSLPVGCVHLSQYLRGFAEFLMDLAAAPEFLQALLDRTTDWWCEFTAAVLDEVGPYVDVVMFGDDVAFDDRPMVDLARYRRFIKPRHRRMVECIKSHTRARVLYHCDGAVVPLIDEFIDLGIDALNPVQVSSVGMDDTAALKARRKPQHIDLAAARREFAALMAGGSPS